MVEQSKKGLCLPYRFSPIRGQADVESTPGNLYLGSLGRRFSHQVTPVDANHPWSMPCALVEG